MSKRFFWSFDMAWSSELPCSITSPAGRMVALGAAALLLTGCMGSKDVTSSIPADYRQRHPIILTQANETLDVFVGNVGGLDLRQKEDVRSFARDYMANGQGPLIAYLPADSQTAGTNAGLNGIRQTLAGGGASGRLQIAHYHAGPGKAAPIKLAFARLKAETPSPCGYEHDEIVPSRFSANAANPQGNNFGCTFQINLAAQVADPRDLVRARQEGPIDVDKRLAGIERNREADQRRIEPGGNTIKKLVQE
jgi:pilus assembly protein CpaD